MDQKKIGCFLKELRKEKELTQEQLAEQFHVSDRTVSRWETGSNMPDLSVLVELAEFYQVEIKEIIDGERKSEKMNEEVKEVAVKMADYAQEQKGKLLIWVRLISLVGTIFMAIVLGLHSMDYEPGILSLIAYVLSIAVFTVMVILTLYTNGMLERIAKHKKFITGCNILIIVVAAWVFYFVIRYLIILIPVFLLESAPFESQSGIENYDKTAICEEYGGDLGSDLLVFPDDTANMIDPTFVSNLKTGFFDTDGYIILQGKYSEEDYKAEVERLASIECTVLDITVGIQYDDESYALPAYVATDGVDYQYEYALADEENCQITYVLLSYPEYVDLTGFEEYLKLDTSEYKLEDPLKQFSIYGRYFEDGVYIEYTDEQ